MGSSIQLITAIASRETKLPGCRVGMIETSAAMGACLLVLIVAVVLGRRLSPRQAQLHTDNDHRAGGELGPQPAPPNLNRGLASRPW